MVDRADLMSHRPAPEVPWLARALGGAWEALTAPHPMEVHAEQFGLPAPGMMDKLWNRPPAEWSRWDAPPYGGEPVTEAEMVRDALSGLIGPGMGTGAITTGLRGGAAPGSLSALAYHGSPHVFDRFDISKIGRGEGAQAYGHGLYFAQNPDVAEWYRAALRRRYHGSRSPETGALYEVDIPDESIDWMLDWDQPLGGQRAGPGAKQVAEAAGLELPRGIRNTWEISPYLIKPDMDGLDDALAKLPDEMKPLAQNVYDTYVALEDARDRWMRSPAAENPSGWGALADPEVEKAEEVWSDAMDAFIRTQEGMRERRTWDQVTGAEFMHEAEKQLSPLDIARMLDEQGVPGVKYYDAFSRGPTGGSQNYVTFTDDIVQELRRAPEQRALGTSMETLLGGIPE